MTSEVFKALYGDGWIEKRSPDGADTHVPAPMGTFKLKRTKRGGLEAKNFVPGANVFGVSEVADAVGENKNKGKALKGQVKGSLKLSKRSPIVKFDDAKKQVFGWAQVASINGEPVLDRQGDMVTIEELSKAAHDFVANSRKGGIMHRRTDTNEPVQVGHIIESVIIDQPIKKALGLPEETPEGWFIGMQVTNDDVWDDYKAGKFPDFSVHGSGKRKPVY